MRLSRRTPETGSREHEILAAALDLFYERGYRGVSLRDLGTALGLNAATLYHYFESKDQILFRLQHDGLEILLRGAQGALQETAGCTPARRLLALMRAHFSYHTEHYKTARLHVAEYRSLEPSSRTIIREKMKEYERLFVQVVTEGVAAGEFVSPAPKIAAFTILGAGAHVSHWYRPGGELPADEVVEAVLRLVMDGLCVRAPSGRPAAGKYPGAVPH